jgi:integrase
MSRLYRRGSIWYAWVYVRQPDGTRKQVCKSTTCTDKQAAKAWLADAERETQLFVKEDPNGRLEALAESFILELRDAGKSEATLEFNQTKVNAVLKVLGQDKHVSALELDVETKYIAARKGEVGSHTIHKELRVLRSLMRLGYRMGYQKIDPKRFKVPYSAGYKPRKGWLSVGQFTALLDKLPANRKATVAFMAYSGARASEWRKLCREHVDLDGWLVLPGEKTPDAWRKIPLKEHLHLRSLMRSVLEATPKDHTGPLFERWHNVWRELHAACKAAELPKLSQNDLRRTFGSWLVQANVPLLKVAKLMGHTSTSMVERVYGVVPDEMLASEVTRTFDALQLPPVVHV